MSDLSGDQFARVKALFEQWCDAPPEQWEAVLGDVHDDAAVVAEVRRLLSAERTDHQRYAAPVLRAMASVFRSPLGSGDVLGAWTLLEEIGAGGMGRIFRARRSDGHFEQIAAIKLLADVPGDSALEFLARERQILASLSHPHIARLLDGGSTPQGQPYLVMEHVDGVPIHRFCERHALSVPARLRLTITVCGAVAFSHRQLVIHCDLKPTNILVTAAGHPVLLDFGVSRLLMAAEMESLQSEASETSAAVTGRAYTPRYASPEQKAGQRIGTATDVYSLGVLLAELLGVPVSDADPLPLSGLPYELAAIVTRATHNEPQRRYAGADALADDLERFLSHHAVRACAPTMTYRGGIWLRRNWRWVGVGVIFIATVAVFSWRMRGERDSALQAGRAALAVKDFMVSVFQGADPEIAGQRDLPVSVLLDAGQARLSSTLGDQPLVRAEIAGILGSVYQNIGKREQAIALLDEAIAIERRNQRPLALAELLYKRAYSTYDMEHFPAAEPIAREALTLRETLTPNAPETINCLRLLGTILLYEEEIEPARGYLTQALDRANHGFGEDSLEAAQAHLDFGRFHLFTELKGDRVVAHARKALAFFERRYGVEDYRYVDALEILVMGLGRTGDFEQALPRARELSEKRTKRYGEISYQAGYGLFTYAEVLNNAGLRLDALPLLMRCLQIQEALDGKGNLSSESPLFTMARLQERLGNLTEALALHRSIIEIRTAHLPADKRALDELNYYVGRSYRLLGDLQKAAPITANVLALRQADSATHPYRLLQSQLEMAIVLRLQGHLDKALSLLASITPEATADSPWRRGYVDAERAHIAMAQGRNELALSLFLKGEAALVAGLGERHPDLWLLRLERAEYLAQSGNAPAARALAMEIRVNAKSSIAPGGDWDRRLSALIAAAR
ncbi:MAG: serine/threonine-protein kinase [Tahibacter sp.]